MVNLNSPSGAVFSEDKRYRYLLWRNWIPDNQRRLLWVMLNPSTANATHDDPTLASCRRISAHQGYGGLEIVNLFAYRTTDPQQLGSTCDPVGIENDECLELVVKAPTDIVVAWGELGVFRDRDCEVLDLLSQNASGPLLCLGLLPNGCPRHPLYMPESTQPLPYLGYKKRCHHRTHNS